MHDLLVFMAGVLAGGLAAAFLMARYVIDYPEDEGH